MNSSFIRCLLFVKRGDLNMLNRVSSFKVKVRIRYSRVAFVQYSTIESTHAWSGFPSLGFSRYTKVISDSRV